jgi:tRNA nucleotidyltransferase (CCA-adding enzyme)
MCQAERSERIRLAILLSQANDSQKASILSNLRLSTKLSSNVLLISKKSAVTLSGDDVCARRLIGGCGDLLEDVLAAASALGNLNKEFEKTVRENLLKNPCTAISDLNVNGSDLLKLGIKGHSVGTTLKKLLEEVLAEPSTNNREFLLRKAAELNNIKKE